MQAWQHAEDMKKKIVSNAMCSWAEAVALSAGEEIDFDRTNCTLATVEAFVELRKVLQLFISFTSPIKSKTPIISLNQSAMTLTQNATFTNPKCYISTNLDPTCIPP